MCIALDARKLTQTDSGIGNDTLHLARALLAEDKALDLLLVCHAPCKQIRLHDRRMREAGFPYPALSSFTQFVLGSFLRRQHCNVLHVLSTWCRGDSTDRHALREQLIAADYTQLVRLRWPTSAQTALAVYRELVCEGLLRI